MSLSNVRASTQDTTAGTQVATATNEGAAAGVIAVSAIVGNKTTWAEASRTGITTPDAPTGGDLTTTGFAGASGANLADAENALSLSVRATCTVANATLTGRIIFYDATPAPVSYSESVTFSSDGTLRLGNASGDFVSQRVLLDCGQARKFRFLVTAVSAGSWSVYARPI